MPPKKPAQCGLAIPCRHIGGIDDPADATGSEAEILAEFEIAYGHMKRRIDAFLALPVEKMDAAELKKQIIASGEMHD